VRKTDLLLDYFRYKLKAGDEHSIHSPFVFDLYINTFYAQKQYYEFNEIEELREKLLKDTTVIEVLDFGAGSTVDNNKKKKIKDIVRISEKPPYLAQFLFRLVNHLKPHTIFDLGTSLGLTTLYLSAPNKNSTVHTFEGCPAISSRALENFKLVNRENIILTTGNIDVTLPERLKNIKKLDFVFFDANHRYKPTMAYFTQCLKYAHEDTVFVFDDIYWSAEMKKSWQEIKNHPDVTITIDIFHMGIVFFRTKQPKQHFVLRIK
jgi:predicted O-methyltransferase YrrM